VATETPAKATLQQRATHEIKELLIVTAYLYITLGAVIAVKTAVLHTEASNSHLGALRSSRPWYWPSSYWLATP
jgi:hypothetical protein